MVNNNHPEISSSIQFLDYQAEAHLYPALFTSSTRALFENEVYPGPILDCFLRAVVNAIHPQNQFTDQEMQEKIANLKTRTSQINNLELNPSECKKFTRNEKRLYPEIAKIAIALNRRILLFQTCRDLEVPNSRVMRFPCLKSFFCSDPGTTLNQNLLIRNPNDICIYQTQTSKYHAFTFIPEVKNARPLWPAPPFLLHPDSNHLKVKKIKEVSYVIIGIPVSSLNEQPN